MKTTSSKRPPFYKRLLLVNWRYQGLLTAYGLLVGLVMTLMAMQFHWLHGSPDSSPLSLNLYTFGALMIFFVMIYAGFVLTHRFFGPLQRIQIHLRKWNETGVWESPQIRQNDYLQELVNELNATIEKHIPKK